MENKKFEEVVKKINDLAEENGVNIYAMVSAQGEKEDEHIAAAIHRGSDIDFTCVFINMIRRNPEFLSKITLSLEILKNDIIENMLSKDDDRTLKEKVVNFFKKRQL